MLGPDASATLTLGTLAATPPPGAWLSPREARVLAGLVAPPRRATWLAGRWLAKAEAALRLADNVARPADIEVLAAPDGAPELFVAGRPLGLCLSITHRAGWAAAALAHDDATLIGVDLELVEPRSAAFVRDYLCPAERRWVAEHADPALAANLVWSAKEAALKALRCGLRRDVTTVEVSPGDGALTVLDRTSGEVMHGRWRTAGAMVLTLVSRPRGDVTAG